MNKLTADGLHHENNYLKQTVCNITDGAIILLYRYFINTDVLMLYVHYISWSYDVSAP